MELQAKVFSKKPWSANHYSLFGKVFQQKTIPNILFNISMDNLHDYIAYLNDWYLFYHQTMHALLTDLN